MSTHRSSVSLKASLVFAALCAVATAQTRKAFEVVSVRQEVPPGRISTPRLLGDRFEALGARPVSLIAQAFGVESARVVAPGWTKAEAFNIKAVIPAGATEADLPEMLQTLLAERFRLKLHIEKRPFPIYELVVLPSGAKLVAVEAKNDLKTQFDSKQPPASDRTEGRPGEEVRQIIGPDERGDRLSTRIITTRASYTMIQRDTGVMELDAERMTVTDFASHVRARVDRVVVDKTGLTGLYRFKTVLPPPPLSQAMTAVLGDRVDTTPSGVSLTRSLEDLGLKLFPKETLSDFVVVDSIDRPSEN